MIYSYSYNSQRIQKAQSFVNYVVLEVLCVAQRPGMPAVFDHNSVIQKYQTLIRDINNDYILTPLNESYQLCKVLDKKKLKVLKKAIHNNNNIIGLCNGSIKPILFSDIKKIDKKLADSIYRFCKYLYTEVMKLKPFKDLFGSLKDHYNGFSIRNEFRSRRCPFCGFARMLNEYNTKKEAYDHYFPKEQYPFTSINFMNLAPMCHTCNSSYKSRKNPINIGNLGINKKVFYPFHNYGEISFSIDINNLNIEKIKPAEIEVTHDLLGFNEEVESWESIFDIKERYKGIYAGDGFNWFEEVRIATKNFGEQYSDYKGYLKSGYYSNENFMKLTFFEACERINLIS